MKKIVSVLVLILVLGGLVRFYHLETFPPSLNWDEVSHGYNAYSVLKTGADEWGKPYPLDSFRAYGDYPLPVDLYLTIPFIALFGLNQVAVRLPSIVLGELLIIPGYFLAFYLGKNKKVALLTAVILAVSPWMVLPSRAVFQSTVALFFFTSGLAVFFASLKNKKLLPLAVVLYGISAYAYHNARIVSVILLPFLVIYTLKIAQLEWKRSVKVSLLLSGGMLIAFFLPLVFILTTTSGRARADWVFLIDQGAVNQIEALRNGSTLPPLVNRLVFNKVTYFVVQGTGNFLGYFSPQFLFLSGGTQYQYSVPGFGLLFPVFAPFFYLGLVLLVVRVLREGDGPSAVALLVLLVAPLPAAITLGQDHVLRSALMVPIVSFTIAYAVARSLSWLRKIGKRLVTVVKILIVGLAAWTFALYLDDLFVSYPVTYSWVWQYGYQQAIEFVKTNYNEYARILVTKKYGEPHEFVLYFWPWDPASYKSDPNLVRYFRTDWYWVDRFGKFYFVNDWEVKTKESSLVIPGQTLMVTSPGNYSGGVLLKEIKFLDGQPTFDIVRL